MARKRILVDSSFLFVLFNSKHKHNRLVQATAQLQGAELVIPYVILTEVAFLFNNAGGIPAVRSFLDTLVKAGLSFEPVTLDDLARSREIMGMYPTAKLDFVDCCIMAISERLNIMQVCTFDRRDFAIFRPKHCEFLEILP